MHKTLFFSLLFLASQWTWAADKPMLRDYPAKQVADKVWVIHGPLGFPSVENQGFMNNPAFVLTDAGVVIIDPGSSTAAGEMVLRQIAKITKQPVVAVFDTHVHGDHWLGNQAIRDAWPHARFYAHPRMIAKAKAGAAEEWLDRMNRSTNGFTANTRAFIPDLPIDQDRVITIGNTLFHIDAPPKAHSNTDVMIAVVEPGVYFTGDNITYKRIPRMDDGTFKGSAAACIVAKTAKANVYIPGHGPSGDASIVDSYCHYLATLYRLAGEMYEEELEDYEMKPRIVKALHAYADWSGFDGEIGKHISLAILEYEASL